MQLNIFILAVSRDTHTVERILKDRAIGHKNRWSLVTGSVLIELQDLHFCHKTNMRSVETGSLL